MARPPMRVRLASEHVELQTPTANKHHLVPNGGLCVSGIRTSSNVLKVWLKVLRIAADPSPNPAADGYEEVTNFDGNNRFVTSTVPGASATGPGDPDNKVMAIPELAGGVDLDATDCVYFTARATSHDLTISAKHCIWFAFANDPPAGSGPPLVGPGMAGDNEENIPATHKPQFVVWPENAASVRIETPVGGGGAWSHYEPDQGNPTGNVDCTADGRAGVPVTLQNPGYRHGMYGSEMIPVPLAIEVGSLIGLWVDVDDVPLGRPFKIGSDLTIMRNAVPNGARKLYLAFHDGKRWHNNLGDLISTHTWTADPCA